MKTLNRVTLIGNLTRDPITINTDRSSVCNFSIATNRQYGGDKEETEFHRLVAWDKLGEICQTLLTTGDKVFIEGRLKTRKFTDKEGIERYTTEVVVKEMIKLSGKDLFDIDPKDVEEFFQREYGTGGDSQEQDNT